MQVSREMFFGLVDNQSSQTQERKDEGGRLSQGKKSPFIPHLIDSHQFFCSIGLVFVQRNKFDVFRRLCLISKGRDQGI